MLDVAVLEAAGLPSAEIAAWRATEPEQAASFEAASEATCAHLPRGEELLGRLPLRPERNDVEAEAAATLKTALDAGRSRFLRAHTDDVYAALTDDLRRALRDEALVYAAKQFGAATGYTETDVHVAFAPYGHAGGSVFEVYMPLYYGASILPIARWRPQPVAEEIERWGGTFFITMGTHIFDLLTLDAELRSCLRSVRLVTSGAGPDSLFEDGERELGFPIVRVYGCSECPGHAIGRLDDPADVRLRQDGVPFPGLEHRIVDPTGAPVEDGKAGEYQVRGPNLFMGYAGQPELTAQAVTEDGFYRSGDLMVSSAQGYINWSGRTKDIIRRGGLQIDPIEMEGMLVQHPKVSMVVVVGEPHPRLGERAVVVAVAENAEDPPSLEECCAHLLAQGLPKQNLPERLIVTDDIPRTELGKFHRVEVKRRVAEGAERSVQHVG